MSEIFQCIVFLLCRHAVVIDKFSTPPDNRAAVAMRLLGWLVVAGFRMSAFQGLVQLQNFLNIPPFRPPPFVKFPPSEIA